MLTQFKVCIFTQSAFKNAFLNKCNASLRCKYRNVLLKIKFYRTPSKLLVTPNQQDHVVPQPKPKICSIISAPTVTSTTKYNVIITAKIDKIRREG